MPLQPAHIQHRPHIDAPAQDRIGRPQPFDQPFDRHGQQGFERIGLYPQVEISRRPPRRIDRAARRHLLPAHCDRPVEHPFGSGHCHHRRDFRPATGLAEHRDIGRITPERGNIVPHPTQGQDEIQLTYIAAIGKARIEPREIKIAQRIEPMIDGHHHYIARRRQMPPVVQRIDYAAIGIGPAMDVQHHRTFRLAPQPRRPNIEEQAIFARHILFSPLRTGWSEPHRVNHALPRLRGNRRAKTTRPGVLPITDAAKHMQPAFAQTSNAALPCHDNWIAWSCHGGRGAQGKSRSDKSAPVDIGHPSSYGVREGYASSVSIVRSP